MADSTITTIRKALAEQVKAGVSRDINVKWYPNSDAPPPLIEVEEDGDSIDYQDTLGRTGAAVLRFTLAITLDSHSPEALVATMDDLLSWDSTSSVYEAVRADRTLGGVVQQTVVLRAQRFPGEPFRAEMPVEITVRKT